jgi:cell division protein FtsW
MKLVPEGLDQWMFFAVIALVAIGLVMVFSASSVISLEDYGDKFHFFKRQVIFAMVGGVGMLFFTLFDYRRLEPLAYPVTVIALLLLLAIHIPGIGVSVRGATRWLQLGPVRLTPSVIAEFAMIHYLAYYLAVNAEKRESFKEYVLPCLGVLGTAFYLILKQPDLSSAVILVVVSIVVITVAYKKIWYMVSLVGAGFAGLAVLVVIDPMRFKRVAAFMNPWEDRFGAGYHVVQSMLALGSGGPFGVGLGQSRQKFEYLPDSFTDFIFAVIGEELGFIGAMVVIGLFVLLVSRGIRAAVGAPDLFGMLFGFGLTVAIGFQSWLNVAVVVGCMPTTGVALPFISYGGTSLVLFMCASGVLLNIALAGAKARYSKNTGQWARVSD